MKPSQEVVSLDLYDKHPSFMSLKLVKTWAPQGWGHGVPRGQSNQSGSLCARSRAQGGFRKPAAVLLPQGEVLSLATAPRAPSASSIGASVLEIACD